LSKKTIDTLIPDILALFRDGHICDEELLAYYGKMVTESLSTQLAEQSAERVPRLRLSAIGKPSRQLFYELTKAPKESLTATTLFKFQYGHILEALFLYLAKEAGHEVTHEQEEVELDGIVGHIDAIIDGVVVDVKSASPYGFLKFKNGTIREADAFNYIPQLAAYSEALGNLDGGFIAINKVNGEICFCGMDSDELKAVNVRDHVVRQKEVQSSTTVPERCYDAVPEGKSGNMALSIGCSYCGFKKECWSDANGGRGLRGFAYSTGPKYLTKVVKQPRVFEISNK
jgi:hypothetical protein